MAEKVPPEAVEEAKRKPGGYVYKIDGEFGPDERMPPERIVGAWNVNKAGKITGDFIPNPNYKKKK